MNKATESASDIRSRVEPLFFQYPQYKGHWDNWLVCKARRRVDGKGGTHLIVGDSVLYDPDSISIAAGYCKDSVRGQMFVTVHSERTNSDVSVPLAATNIPAPTGAALQAIQDAAKAEDKRVADWLEPRKKTVPTIEEALAVARAVLEGGETCGIFPRPDGFLVNKDIVQMR